MNNNNNKLKNKNLRYLFKCIIFLGISLVIVSWLFQFELILYFFPDIVIDQLNDVFKNEYYFSLENDYLSQYQYVFYDKKYDFDSFNHYNSIYLYTIYKYKKFIKLLQFNYIYRKRHKLRFVNDPIRGEGYLRVSHRKNYLYTYTNYFRVKYVNKMPRFIRFYVSLNERYLKIRLLLYKKLLKEYSFFEKFFLQFSESYTLVSDFFQKHSEFMKLGKLRKIIIAYPPFAEQHDEAKRAQILRHYFTLKKLNETLKTYNFNANNIFNSRSVRRHFEKLAEKLVEDMNKRYEHALSIGEKLTNVTNFYNSIPIYNNYWNLIYKKFAKYIYRFYYKDRIVPYRFINFYKIHQLRFLNNYIRTNIVNYKKKQYEPYEIKIKPYGFLDTKEVLWIARWYGTLFTWMVKPKYRFSRFYDELFLLSPKNISNTALFLSETIWNHFDRILEVFNFKGIRIQDRLKRYNFFKRIVSRYGYRSKNFFFFKKSKNFEFKKFFIFKLNSNNFIFMFNWHVINILFYMLFNLKKNIMKFFFSVKRVKLEGLDFFLKKKKMKKKKLYNFFYDQYKVYKYEKKRFFNEKYFIIKIFSIFGFLFKKIWILIYKFCYYLIFYLKKVLIFFINTLTAIFKNNVIFMFFYKIGYNFIMYVVMIYKFIRWKYKAIRKFDYKLKMIYEYFQLVFFNILYKKNLDMYECLFYFIRYLVIGFYRIHFVSSFLYNLYEYKLLILRAIIYSVYYYYFLKFFYKIWRIFPIEDNFYYSWEIFFLFFFFSFMIVMFSAGSTIFFGFWFGLIEMYS